MMVSLKPSAAPSSIETAVALQVGNRIDQKIALSHDTTADRDESQHETEA